MKAIFQKKLTMKNIFQKSYKKQFP